MFFDNPGISVFVTNHPITSIHCDCLLSLHPDRTMDALIRKIAGDFYHDQLPSRERTGAFLARDDRQKYTSRFNHVIFLTHVPVQYPLSALFLLALKKAKKAKMTSIVVPLDVFKDHYNLNTSQAAHALNAALFTFDNRWFLRTPYVRHIHVVCSEVATVQQIMSVS